MNSTSTTSNKIDPSLNSEVLIVDDTMESLGLLSDIMTSAGYTIRQAVDGEMALVSVKKRSPDLILLDVRMPGIDGFEVCRRLKEDPASSKIPIIFLSAHSDAEARIDGLKLGAMDFISKPFEVEEVLLRVRTHLELYNLQLRLGEMCDYRTQQLNDEIQERRQAESELYKSRQELRELTAHLQDVREAERSRIAREIHDELGQQLTVMRIDLAHLSSNLDITKSELEYEISKLIGIVDHASDTARSISENLRPGMLDLLGLGAAIEHHVKRFSESTHIDCTLQQDELDELEINSKLATAIFRVVQEALTNVARHAQANHVSIDIRTANDNLTVVIEDNGVGLEQDEITSSRGHYGLLGMYERAQSLGGQLSIENGASGGTRITATLPYIDQEAL